MTWIGVALWGGIVGLDGTSFPQAMISRPLVAGCVTGLLFGRPVDGLVVGFLLEAFALITLPIGAATYPESGTATVAAASAYLAVTPGLEPGYLLLALAFALGWERLGSLTVVLQRRANGKMLIRTHAVAAAKLERRHLAAMTLDFLRGVVLCGVGGLLGMTLLGLLGPYWGLSPQVTAALLAVATAGMLATALTLFGGLTGRLAVVLVGIVAGVLTALVMP